jgi:hypothetical protein
MESAVNDELSTQRTTREARQGVTGHNVRYVLLTSCALALVLLGIVFMLVGK